MWETAPTVTVSALGLYRTRAQSLKNECGLEESIRAGGGEKQYSTNSGLILDSLSKLDNIGATPVLCLSKVSAFGNGTTPSPY